MKFASALIKLDSNVWSHAVLVPDHISKHFIKGGNKRVVATLNNLTEIHCALMAGGTLGYFININKELRSRYGWKEGDILQIELQADQSEYGVPIPEEMEQAMALDQEGAHFFKSLSMGKQRALLHIIGKPKSAELRIKKSLLVLHYLSTVQGKLNFRELNQAFKDSNQNHTL